MISLYFYMRFIQALVFLPNKDIDHQKIFAVIKIKGFILFRSAIITGCKPWTLYEKQGYKGKCGCIYPNFIGGNYPNFFPDLKKIGGIVASAKKNCDQKCGETLLPDTTMILKSNYARKDFAKSGNDEKFCHN